MLREIGSITAKELRATGIAWDFTPSVSVARDQRWGRTYEAYSEVPALVNMLTPFIECMQGATLGASDKVMATAKHYVGDGGAEWGTSDIGQIDRGDATMSEAALRAIHLHPYTFAIADGVGAVMASFSSFSGTRMTGSEHWLDTVLNQELGFDGMIVSDWNAIDGLGGSMGNNVRQAINAGVDVFMQPDTWKSFMQNLETEVTNNRVNMARWTMP